MADGSTGVETVSSTKSVGNTWTDYNSLTIQKNGVYSIRLYMNGGSASTTKMRSSARILKNGSTLMGVAAWSISNYAGNNFAEEYDTQVFWLEKDDVLKTQGNNDNWTGNNNVQMSVKQIY